MRRATLKRTALAHGIVYLLLFTAGATGNSDEDNLRSIYPPASIMRTYPDMEDRQRKPSEDWRLDKSFHKYWVNSWKAYAKRDFETAIQKLEPLLNEQLTPAQIDEVHYAMAFNYRSLAHEAHLAKDVEAKIRYLKSAAEIERYPPTLTVDNFQIAQAYRSLEDWHQCAEFGERAFNVKLRWIRYASIKSLIVAECQLKAKNIDRARFWVNVALKMRDEKGQRIISEQQWVIDAVDSAFNAKKTDDQ